MNFTFLNLKLLQSLSMATCLTGSKPYFPTDEKPVSLLRSQLYSIELDFGLQSQIVASPIILWSIVEIQLSCLKSEIGNNKCQNEKNHSGRNVLIFFMQNMIPHGQKHK